MPQPDDRKSNAEFINALRNCLGLSPLTGLDLPASIDTFELPEPVLGWRPLSDEYQSSLRRFAGINNAAAPLLRRKF